MLSRIKSYLIGSGKKILTSIGFIPTLVALSITCLAIFLILIDSPDKDWVLQEALPILEIQYGATARDLVTAFLAGTISLIIFSFTMMMFVLQQAATNYSSKIIGGIISNKSTQLILGFYVGTIIYMILTLIQIREADEFDEVPQLPIYVGLLIFVACIILFVKFINDIYSSVQIYKVMERIHHKTVKSIRKQENKQGQDAVGDYQWHIYKAQSSGYFQDISRDSLVKLAMKHDLVVKLNLPKGFYHGIGEPLFSLNKKVEDKEIIEVIIQDIIFYSGEKISDNYFFGVRQLSEVAVQSLSTGINAPGVAIACLDYIGDLLVMLSQSNQTGLIKDKDEKVRIIIPAITNHELLEICITPIRIYGKKDLNILISLLNLFKRIGYNDENKSFQNPVLMHFSAVLEDGRNHLENRMDRTRLIESAEKVQREVYEYFSGINIHGFL